MLPFFNLYFLLLLSSQASIRNMLCKEPSRTACLYLGEPLRTGAIRTTVYIIYWQSAVESSQNISFVFFIFPVNCLCCGWAFNSCHFAPSLSKKCHCSVLADRWTHVDPLHLEVRRHLVRFHRSLHAMLHWHFLLWNVCLSGLHCLSGDTRRQQAINQKENCSERTERGPIGGPVCELLSHCLLSL